MKLVIHGGAGVINKDNLSAKQIKAYHAVLKLALQNGYAVLKTGGSSVDAVETAVKVMEDSPLFNAGRGSVLTAQNTIEMDAAIMEGASLNCGAVAAVSRIKNPVSLARKVMENSKHILLAGKGAEAFALEQNLTIETDDYFFTDARKKQLEQAKQKNQLNLDHSDDKYGTVGAVAIDSQGNLAAATSTGGMTNKQYGRVGDSPLIGAGTYANHQVAVSCTGIGELFIKNVVAYDVAAQMQYLNASLKEAADNIIFKKLPAGSGGLIAVDENGNIAMPFNTKGMFRGFAYNEKIQTFIWED
jgi:beta-aspartyl-peptidase (threonine type)